MTANKGKVVSINGNLLSVQFDGDVSMNEICYVVVDGTRLKSEVIRIRGNIAQIQVYEMTNGIKCGDEVEFTGNMLSALLGPGLLGQVYDGLQNPLPELAQQAGWFLERGVYADGLDTEKKWENSMFSTSYRHYCTHPSCSCVPCHLTQTPNRHAHHHKRPTEFPYYKYNRPAL